MNHQKYRSSGKPFSYSITVSFKALTILSILILVDGFTVPSAYAQIDGVEIGDRVRISAPTVERGKIRGTVSSTSSYQMELSAKDTTYFVPYNSIRQMELSTGKRKYVGRGALIGAISGGLIGGLASYADHVANECEGPYCFFNTDGAAFALGGLLGAPLGALIGVGIGSIERDVWEKIPANISAGVTPSFKNQKLTPAVTFRVTF